MDQLDAGILAVLRDDARASFTQIAQKMGTSEGTIRARMKRLVQDNVITKFTIRTAGKHVKALIEVQLESNRDANKVAADIGRWDDVESCWEITGEQDILVVAQCDTTGALNGLIDRIRAINGTQATRSRLILAEHA